MRFLRAQGLTHARVLVPTHDPKRFDRLTRRAGAHALVMQGLANLAAAGVRITLRVPLIRPTIQDLPTIIQALCAQVPSAIGVDLVHLDIADPSWNVRVSEVDAVLLLIDPRREADAAQDADLIEMIGQRTGKPVIVADHGGQREIIEDRRTGLRVEPGSPASLATGIGALLALDPAERQSLGEAGRVHVRERFSKRGLQAATLSVYKRVFDAREERQK